MQKIHLHKIRTLKFLCTKFDKESSSKKYQILQSCNTGNLPQHKYFKEYYEILLFMAAYPDNSNIKLIVSKELKRLATYLKNTSDREKIPFENTGLPFVRTITRFSPDFLLWLLNQHNIDVEFDSFYLPSLTLNEVFKFTLPSLLASETTAGLSNEDLLHILGVPRNHYLEYILHQLQQLDERPLMKDLMMEKLDIYIKMIPKGLAFSRAFNFLKRNSYCFHNDLIKHFDHWTLLNEAIPNPSTLSEKEKNSAISICKNAMALNCRETDPTTYMEEASFKFYKLERGIDVAIYGMTAERQLPLESYIGFTLFKNGYPVSYGGTWIFGLRAKFGMNVFETFRGGESGYIMCQLLRLYRHVFNISFFEIEAYQFGLGNHDGIESGAFWFYHRFGFRPMDKELFLLSEAEHGKIKQNKTYRTSEKTLLKFTGSNMALNLAGKIHMTMDEISTRVKAWIKKECKNNCLSAEQLAMEEFCKLTKLEFSSLSSEEQSVLKEISMWAVAMKVSDAPRLKLMRSMVFAKPRDVYTYQNLLLEFFKIKA